MARFVSLMNARRDSAIAALHACCSLAPDAQKQFLATYSRVLKERAAKRKATP